MKLVLSVLRSQKSKSYGVRFQIVHHSIQTNHLHFIVEAHLKGEAESLKEYSIGVEVFERNPLSPKCLSAA